MDICLLVSDIPIYLPISISIDLSQFYYYLNSIFFIGAIARSASATAVHPLNVWKTLLQTQNGRKPEMKWDVLTRGAGSQFIMSIPHGALK